MPWAYSWLNWEGECATSLVCEFSMCHPYRPPAPLPGACSRRFYFINLSAAFLSSVDFGLLTLCLAIISVGLTALP